MLRSFIRKRLRPFMGAKQFYTLLGVPLFLFAALFILPLVVAQVTVSQLGYHPDQEKRVVFYSQDNVQQFEVRTTQGELSYTGNFTQVSCQGGQACLVGDFSELNTQGTYVIHVGNDSSTSFPIHTDVYADNLPIYAELFDALRMQGSSFHPDHHAAANPPLTIMADGSFLMTTEQASMTVIRLGQAYEVNPSALSFSVHETERPDMVVHIKEYVDFLAGLQDHDGTLAIPQGWFYNFGCPQDYTLSQGQHNEQQDDCLRWEGQSDTRSNARGIAAYAHALTAITHEYGDVAGGELLDRIIRTDEYIQNTSSLSAEPGLIGATLFILYDFTGEQEYLDRAYNLQDRVETTLHPDFTTGPELYWNEYIRHKDVLEEHNYTYARDGLTPEEMFADKAASDWNSVQERGERAPFSAGREFQHGRLALMSAVHGELAATHASSTLGPELSESQIAWLTGQNSVDWHSAGMQSKSFIFGIGDYGVSQHIRLVPSGFFKQEREWLNGHTHIHGWITGPYDSNRDGMLDYQDNYHAWRHTESTNHIGALGVLAFAQMDARLNNKQPLQRPFVTPIPADPSDPIIIEDPNNATCFETLRDMPVSCIGGEILIDTTDGCREIVCEGMNGAVQVLACNKPDGQAQYFEMYRHSFTGTAPQVCLGETCIQQNGFAKSQNYPICLGDQPPQEPLTLTVHSPTNNTYTSPISVRTSTNRAANISYLLNNEEYAACTECTSYSSTHELEAGKHIIAFTAQAGNQTIQQDVSFTVSETDQVGICYTSVQNIPATCQQGKIIFDEWNGCRQIVCESADGGIQVLACDKPDGASEYFEMYRQGYIGTVPELCLGDACIQQNGFAQSQEYPLCAEETSPDTQPEDKEVSVTLRIADWYPQETHVVFVCEESGFQADTYHFTFGDGNSHTRLVGDVYHIYEQSGNYTVTCIATQAEIQHEQHLEVSIE